MNGPNGVSAKRQQLRERVARVVYPPFLAALILGMIATVFLAIAVIYYANSQSLEPDWLSKLAPTLELAGKLFDPAESDASRALDTVYVAVIGLVMGVFLRRCATGANRWELTAIILMMALGAIQLILILLLPSSEDASLAISDGDRLVRDLSILLARNANIALAIFSAALGIQLVKEDTNDG